MNKTILKESTQKLDPPAAALDEPTVRNLVETDTGRWTRFVADHPDSNIYHTVVWRDFLASCFGHTPLYLFSERGGNISGVLPLFLVRNAFLGSKLLSLPYDISSGGALSLDLPSEKALSEHAIALARHHRVQYLEFRSAERRQVLVNLALHSTEPAIVSEMELDGEAAVWGRVSTDHAKAIRKAKNRGIEIRLASTEKEFADFYQIYLRVFRAFGTPPYGAHYFDLLYQRLHSEGHVKLFLAFNKGRCVGGLQLFCWGGNIVSKFAACLPEAVPLRAYAALYGAAIEFGLKAGYRRLSWGSSTRNQRGLILFKEGWGAKSRGVSLYTLPVRGRCPDIEKYYDTEGFPQRIWRNLPLSLTRILGHSINRWFC